MARQSDYVKVSSGRLKLNLLKVTRDVSCEGGVAPVWEKELADDKTILEGFRKKAKLKHYLEIETFDMAIIITNRTELTCERNWWKILIF